MNISDLSGTIVPKSEQLDADELLAGPRTIRITDVRVIDSQDQPVSIFFEGDEGRPWKPSKTVRKILILGWGVDGRAWIGRYVTIFNEPTVKFGGMQVGGIRVSHMSHIERAIRVSLNATKGKKGEHIVQPLEVPQESPAVTLDAVLSAIHNATNKQTMEYAKQMAMALTNEEDVRVAQDAYKNRVAELKATPQ